MHFRFRLRSEFREAREAARAEERSESVHTPRYANGSVGERSYRPERVRRQPANGVRNLDARSSESRCGKRLCLHKWDHREG